VRRRAASDLSLRTAAASTVSVSLVFITRILSKLHVLVKRAGSGKRASRKAK
jgi:hypothetical protein